MKNILVVEDEKFIRQGIIAFIERSGVPYGKIFSAENGVLAMDILQKYPIDLVLTDIRMPHMDGLELLKSMRARNIDSIVVIISGYDEFNYAVEAMHFGAKEYILKPLQRDSFTELLFRMDKTIEEAHITIPPFLKVSSDIVKKILGNREINSRVILKAVCFIEENYSKDINMATISNHVSVNYTVFSESFKEETGINFNSFLKRFRIEKSKELIVTGNDKIIDIAKAVGFQDEKHFSKTFNTITGMSPTDFRKKYMQ